MDAVEYGLDEYTLAQVATFWNDYSITINIPIHGNGDNEIYIVGLCLLSYPVMLFR